MNELLNCSRIERLSSKFQFFAHSIHAKRFAWLKDLRRYILPSQKVSSSTTHEKMRIKWSQRNFSLIEKKSKNNISAMKRSRVRQLQSLMPCLIEALNWITRKDGDRRLLILQLIFPIMEHRVKFQLGSWHMRYADVEEETTTTMEMNFTTFHSHFL